MSQLKAKAIITTSALPAFLLAKSAISHSWALGMKQRQYLCAHRGETHCGGGAKSEENDKAIGVYEFLILDYLAVVLLNSYACHLRFNVQHRSLVITMEVAASIGLAPRVHSITT